MSEPSENSCEELWRRLVEAEAAFYFARMALFSSCRSKFVDLTRAALQHPNQRITALNIAKLLTIEERQSLFPDLLAMACFGHGLTGAAYELVLSLPHEWLINNIEEAAEPLLKHDDYEQYRGLFQIYIELDLKLARSLAERTAKHSDIDIREASDDFFRALDVRSNVSTRLPGD